MESDEIIVNVVYSVMFHLLDNNSYFIRYMTLFCLFPLFPAFHIHFVPLTPTRSTQ